MEKRLRDPKKPEATAETSSSVAAPGPSAQAAAEESGDELRRLRDSATALRTSLRNYADTSGDKLEAACRGISSAWLIHEALVDEFVLNNLGADGRSDTSIEDHEVEVDTAKILIRALAGTRGDAERMALMRALVRRIEHLLDAEEAPESGLFARAETEKSPDLADRIERRWAALERDVMASSPMLTRLGAALVEKRNREENDDMRSNDMRERDDQGRFVSDDDRGGRGRSERGGYESSSRRSSRSDDRDEYGRFSGRDDDGRSNGRDRDRDDYGRFMSDRDDRGGSRSDDYRDDRGRFTSQRDDDDRGSRGRGHGGWFGDSEGHREAARQGSRSRSESYDDDRRSGRSDRDDDGRGRGRSDDYDDRQARGRDDDGRDGRGWFGDREGHAEAAREGWRTRHRDDDDRDGRSRGRDDDRDERSGGWFGDPRGHSEASRRGWQNRR